MSNVPVQVPRGPMELCEAVRARSSQELIVVLKESSLVVPVCVGAAVNFHKGFL